jgi:DNA-binding winged helix-turn-helix (wHTH) protein
MGVSATQEVGFGPFRFDLTTVRLWRGEREIGLRARAKAVLHYLLTHPGRVIAREELEQQVWAGTHVSKTALRVCIWEIRQALEEQPAAPQYIETVGQQGYRWVAGLRAGQEETDAASSAVARGPRSVAPFVGRQAELALLRCQVVVRKFIAVFLPPCNTTRRLAGNKRKFDLLTSGFVNDQELLRLIAA